MTAPTSPFPKPLSRAISVVVPSVNRIDDLLGCLAALEAQRADVDLEVIVVDRLGDPVRRVVGERFPSAIVIPVPPSTTIPEMRARGFEAVSKSVVGVIEDHVIVPPGWARRMIEALEASGADAVGGAVENAATRTLAERAAFVCEYHQLLPPIPAGQVDGLAGNNVVYRRSTLERHRAAWSAGRWENHLHDAIRAAGGTLVSRPEIVVGHKMHYGFFEYLSQRYLYSRSYAGARVTGAPPARRAFYGLASVALPAVIFARICATVWRKPGMRGELVRSLPFLVPFCLSWGAGEVVGYWLGAGNSLAKVR